MDGIIEGNRTSVEVPLTPEALERLAGEVQTALAAADTLEALEAIRVTYLGRKGQVSQLKRGLKDVPPEQKPVIGQRLNELDAELENYFNQCHQRLESAALNSRLQAETLDVTMPGTARVLGGYHPLTQVTQRICNIFYGMGFEVLDDNLCPEVETEYYNFEALNFPPDHPARDMQDTFYTDIAPHVLLRSQTSNAQIRYMEGRKPPIRVVAPGRVYRNEAVNSRKNVLFHQIEGLLVDQNVRFSDLKGVLHEFVRQFFGAERPTRFRNSFFPFTEPSAEVDVQCIFCQGDGCRVCSHTGWLEILGAGMVHPNVLSQVGIDPEQYNGFAFGLGVERMTMLRDGLDDIRLFYQNDLRVLERFKTI
ncbi:MAG: phenylalanine--tRNA ligase subunit alpha [Candidatus Melainabacteria bacterium]|nr:phenylalanine--tRNA ligase subunit alpha [Candidatus Melainabacteria bacterium]